MAMTQTELNKKYQEKHGIVQKKFNLDRETAARLEQLAKQLNMTQVAVLRAALVCLEKHRDI